jgi:uncharacterized protein (DUF1499 family)
MRARPIVTGLLGAGLAVAVLAAALRLFMSRPAEDRLAPQEQVDIAALRAPLPPPSFLACPPSYCAAHPAITTPVFAVSWQHLKDDWTGMIGAEPRVVRVETRSDRRRFVYIQHSPAFGFPDIITVEFVALGPDRSGIALYSRSRYGRNDFGKNRERVERWLRLLEKIAPAAASGPQPRRALQQGAG